MLKVECSIYTFILELSLESFNRSVRLETIIWLDDRCAGIQRNALHFLS